MYTAAINRVRWLAHDNNRVENKRRVTVCGTVAQRKRVVGRERAANGRHQGHTHTHTRTHDIVARGEFYDTSDR